MEWQESSYLISLFFFSGAFVLIGLLAWQRRKAPGSLPLVFFMLAVAEWTFVSAIEYSVGLLPLKIILAKIEYFGAVSSPIFLLWFILEFSSQKKLIFRRWYLFFWAIPLITLCLVWTNELHHLIWTDIAVPAGSDTGQPVYDHGIWFWIYVVYDYFVLFSASIMLVRSAYKFRHIFRYQALVLVIALPFPWLGNIFYIFRLANSGMDFTAVGLGITGIILSLSMYRLQLFDLIPVAREQVIEWMDESLIVFNTQKRLVDYNPAAERLFTHLGMDIPRTLGSNWMGKTISDFQLNFPRLEEVFDKHTDGRFEVRMENNGSALDFDIRVLVIGRKKEDVSGWMVLVRDITDLNKARETAYQARDQAIATADENNRLYEQLKQMAVIDSLTRLNIRGHFFELAGAVFTGAAALKQPVSVMMLDLDHFKQINDTYGHANGDRALQNVAQIFMDSLRRRDIIGRYGGEEFVAFLPETDLAEAVQVANRLCARIAANVLETPRGEIHISASIGVAAVRDSQDTLESLIDRADQAMYQAKQAGRNQVKFIS